MVPKPITRKDAYYAYLINGSGELPTPITREDNYLYFLCKTGFGGGAATPEMIQNAVDNYLTRNPVENDYAMSENKPQINGTTLEGDLTFADLGLSEEDTDIDFSKYFS